MITGSVQVNKGYWYCVLRLRDENGKVKQKWFSTGLAEKGNKKKAKQQLSMLLDKYANCSTITKYYDMPFDQYCQYWLDEKKTSIETVTYDGYDIKIKHIIEYFKPRNIKLKDVSPRDIQEFYNYLATDGNRFEYAKEKGLSQRSIHDISLLVKSIFRFAVLMEDIPVSPAEKISVPKKKRGDIKPDNYIDSTDLEQLLKELKGHRLEDVFIVTLFLGLRRSELLGLRWSAINFDKRTLTINHTVSRVRKAVAKDSTKTDCSYRTYPLDDFLLEVLTRVKTRQDAYKKSMGSSYHPSDYVFTWEDGRPYSPDYITKTFRKLVKKSDYFSSDLKLHDLRKSCVSLLIEGGCSVKEVQKWVGHADSRTTMDIYAKMKESKKVDIANTLGQTFRNAI